MKFSAISLNYWSSDARVYGMSTEQIFRVNPKFDDDWQLVNAEGLGPSVRYAKINDYASMNSPGSVGGYSSREIVLTIDILRNSDVDLVRERLYNLLNYRWNAERGLVLRILDENDNELCQVEGYLKKFETEIFSENPFVQITFGTQYPFFYKDTQTVKTFASPLYNGGYEIVVPYEGTAPVYFSMRFEPVRNLSSSYTGNFTLQANGGWFESKESVDGTRSNAYVAMTNENGVRSFTGTISNSSLIALSKTNDSFWPMLLPGDNRFFISPKPFGIKSYSYTVAYLGV